MLTAATKCASASQSERDSVSES